MFYRRIAEQNGVSIAHGTASAARPLTRRDGLGFSLSVVTAPAGATHELWYQNHWEANYVFEGDGTLEHHGTGEVLRLEPGMLYCVGPDDPHTLSAGTGLHIVSLFNPPLTGTEVHDADGAYPPTGPVPPGPGKA